jgi:radical SAM protein with 4Fe4S-binding SPASM domain
MKCLIKEDLRKYFNYGCHIFYGSGLIINPENEILLCTHWTEKPIAKINPSISLKEFNSLWNNLDHIRDIISKRPYKKCSTCVYKNSCFGGCPVFWQ